MLFRCAKTGGVALICRLAQQHATLTAKIGIENLHKRCAEFLNASTASNASAYDYLTTYPRSSLYGVRMATRPIGSRVSLNYDLMPAE